MENKIKILVVDDNTSLTKLFQYYFDGFNYETIISNDVKNTFAIANSQNFNVIFLDYKMPGWTADHLLHELSLVNKFPKTVIMSGYDITEIKPRLENYSNIIGFLAKPFDMEILSTYIDKLEQRI